MRVVVTEAALGWSQPETRRYRVAVGVLIGAKAAASEIYGLRGTIHGHIDQTNTSVP